MDDAFATMEQSKLRNSSGSFAILTAIRRASPLCAAPRIFVIGAVVMMTSFLTFDLLLDGRLQ